MNGVNLIFHAAALKQVPLVRILPYGSGEENIIGTENVLTQQLKKELRLRFACQLTSLPIL
jgi:FlaA1/EpsC-like NDP-sugar epimerase